MTRETLQDLLVGPLRDVYCPEHHALKTSMSAATHERFTQVLTNHLDEVGWNVECLEQVFDLLRESSCGATCDGDELLAEIGDVLLVGDAASAQKMRAA